MKNEVTEITRNKSRKLLFLAIGFALIAGLGTMLYLKAMESRLKARLAPKKEATVAVVVASKDLQQGAVIDSANMAIRHVPSEYVNTDVVTPEAFDSVAGGTLIKPLEHGKMLTMEMIDLNLPKDFSATIKEGHRAMTIEVDEVNSISGLIRPGNFIDIYLKLSIQNAPGVNRQKNLGKSMVIPVLENVLVLATDHASARPNEDEFLNNTGEKKQRAYNTLTLELVPKDVSLLTLAESTGMILTALRNPDEKAGALFDEVTTSDLLVNAQQLLRDTMNKNYNRSVDGVHYDKDGKLVTRDGVPLKDQSLRLDKDGHLVTKDGVVLNGRNLIVGSDGSVQTDGGSIVDTKNLIAGKGGTLIDKNGNVLSSNGLKTLKGGFLQDKDGNILTQDGRVLKGVHVDEKGDVVTSNGTKLSSDSIEVGKDGKIKKDGKVLAGVSAGPAGKLAFKTGAVEGELNFSDINRYQVEYIVGGRSRDGTAKTFSVVVDKDMKPESDKQE